MARKTLAEKMAETATDAQVVEAYRAACEALRLPCHTALWTARQQVKQASAKEMLRRGIGQ